MIDSAIADLPPRIVRMVQVALANAGIARAQRALDQLREAIQTSTAASPV